MARYYSYDAAKRRVKKHSKKPFLTVENLIAIIVLEVAVTVGVITALWKWG